MISAAAAPPASGGGGGEHVAASRLAERVHTLRRDNVTVAEESDEIIDVEAEDVEAEYVETVTEEQVRVRRMPKVGRWMALGGAVFGIAAAVATYSVPYDPDTAGYDRNVVFGFVLLFALAFGVGIGGLAAAVAERSTRGARVVAAEHIVARARDDDSA